ncbi:unnamed protein product [Candidula unifasciata]|uniref:C-type lectin domain-containing protein n=1 Tax=Candidula unifasciata TaxID=100452 RepID=A0A8S3Z1G2_9EUPU|nr:unnamed protein product [Candidula unifasciata]
MLRSCPTSVALFFVFLAVVSSQDEPDRQRPCEHPNAISLPQDKKCLVPVRSAYTWVNAASTCERAGGSLFQTPDALLGSRPDLMRCLAAMADSTYAAMWINALGVWSPHFKWTNGSATNRVDFCTTLRPPREDNHNVTSDTLSVDYCVKTCHDKGAIYTIYFNNSRTLECYCHHALDASYMATCPVTTVDTNTQGVYYILLSKPDSLIQITGTNVTSRTEILCSTVDDSTFRVRRQITSEKCFNRQHFICDLGDEAKCVNKNCQTTECYFVLKRRCLLRVGINYHWYAARAYCQNRDGDLWNMFQLSDLADVPMLSDRVTKYWIGATNYNWRFNATSASLGSVPSKDYNRLRCGHMVRQGNSLSELTYQWSDTVCDQQKSFLCQFAKTAFNPDEMNLETACPWATPPPPITAGPGVITGVPVTGTNVPPNPSNEPVVGTAGDVDSFPIGAVIAAIIAGLVLLTCLGLTLAYCSRRNWMAGRFRKVREPLTFIPYFADVSGADYESHANMSSVSDHGSQVGLVKSGYHHNTSGYGMSTSYGEQSGAFSSKSLDRRHKETLDRKLAESQNYLASGNSSMDERGFSATYNTLPNRPRDLMTLQAHMDIKDEAELAALRASFRNRPEVALVTDNVDMNFTVNHAVSRTHSHADSELSRSSLERTMEEINLPVSEGGLGLHLPERVAEEARIFSTLSNNYHK